MSVLVMDTEYGWYIRCGVCGHHYIPKDRWQFNGDVERPTFTPSINETVNPPDHKDYRPDIKTRRCHFIITNGTISYCGDCTHELAGQTLPMVPIPDVEVRMNEIRRK